MSRVLFAALVVLSLAACDDASVARLSPADWTEYASKYLLPDGRVVDTGNGCISHSEGQGYGMLLAVSANDRAAFERMWRWTQAHLQVRDDKLFAWKWVPNAAEPVPDSNNASDGDLLIAWALARAARRWGEPGYATAAREIAGDIRRHLIVPSPIGPVLLPGRDGFRKPDQLTLNPSYWVFPALKAMQRLDPDPVWRQLQASGETLLKRGLFGEQQLPPDWLVLQDEVVSLPETLPARFGFDAVRVPLYSCWNRQRQLPVLRTVKDFWDQPDASAWVDLRSGERAEYGLTPGQLQVQALLERCLDAPDSEPPDVRLSGIDYYADTLALLSALAGLEGAR